MPALGLLQSISVTLPASLGLPKGFGTDMLDTDKAAQLFAGRFTHLALDITVALIIVTVGWVFSRWLATFVTRSLMRTKLEETYAAFLGSVARYTIVFIAILAALTRVGFTSNGMLAVLGAAGLAVGLSLKDFLTHIAAGIMLMVTQPFRVNHGIECGDFKGTVKRITLFNTEINTTYNQRVYIPNAVIWNSAIINNSYNLTRQFEVSVQVSYDDDIEAVTALFLKTLLAHPKIRNEPQPFVGVDSFGEAGVHYLVRAWVKTSEFGDVRYTILKDLKKALDDAGMSIAYPVRVLRMAGTAGITKPAVRRKKSKKG